MSSGVVYIPLYVSDWRGNAKLARCSMAAHGVWINLLCIMADADECGVLVVDGEVWGDEEIVGVIGGNRKVVLNALDELRARKVLRQRKSDGAYYSSRLVREGKRIRKRSESARMAAEARWGHADAMRTQCDRNADASPTHCADDADAMPTRTRVRTRTRTRKNTSAAKAISWSPDDGWQGITDADRDRWTAAYPACNLDRQLASMTAWLVANPDRAKKSNWARFIDGWLKREQDRGGDARGVTHGRSGSGQAAGGTPRESAEERRRRERAGEYPEPGRADQQETLGTGGW